MRSSCSSVWIGKRLRKARDFEVQKILWKILFQSTRKLKHFNDEKVDGHFDIFDLLRSLMRERLHCMASELKDRRTFFAYLNGTTSTHHLQNITTAQEEARQRILKSKIFARTLKILHKVHTSHKATTSKTSVKVRVSDGRQQLQLAGRRGRVPPSFRSQRYEKTSILDSVFVSSLSSRRTQITKQRDTKQRNSYSRQQLKQTNIQKNRVGQRERRQQAVMVYGSAAKHLKKAKRHPNSYSGTNKFVRKPIAHPPKTPLTSHTHNTTPTKQLHPSWEASKKKKELNKLVQPQGQRIVFNDSD